MGFFGHESELKQIQKELARLRELKSIEDMKNEVESLKKELGVKTSTDSPDGNDGLRKLMEANGIPCTDVRTLEGRNRA